MVVFQRSRRPLRCLSVVALLAWLMLATAPSAAWSPMASAPRTSMLNAHASMHVDGAACCDDHAHQPGRSAPISCHCALACAGVLPAAPAGLAAMLPIRADYAPPRSIEAPLSGFAPPLRPPLA